MKYAASITSPATPYCCDHFLHSLISLPHQVAPTAHLEFVNIPLVNYFSNNSTEFNTNFTFSVTFHFFAALLSLLDLFPLLMAHFYKYHMGLSLGDKEPTQPCAFLSVCRLDTVGQGTGPNRLRKDVPTCHLRNDPRAEEQAMKFVLDASTHSYYTMLTKKLNHRAWDWC